MNEIAGCVPSSLEGTQPRHTPPPSSKNVLSKATVAPSAESSDRVMSRRSSTSQESPSASVAAARHVQITHPVRGPSAVLERSVSTTIELFARRRRHPEVEMLACASEKRWRAMVHIWFVARQLTAGKGTSTAGVARAATGIPVASALQSAATGKRFFDAMGSPYLFWTVSICAATGCV